jgi:hypothetical protein
MTLAPGLTAALLAVLGLSFGAWTLRRRVALAGFAVVAALFAMGTRGPWGGRLTYRLLFDHVPGWQGVRTPSRLVVWTLLALGLLAAVGADRVVAAVTRWLPRSGLPAALTAGLLAGLIVLEGIGTNPHPRPAPEPAVLRTAAAAGEPMLVLPSDEIGDETVMWWSTDGFPRVVNGGSGFVPRETSALRAATADFPSTDAVRVLRAVGVHRVVVLLERFDPGAAALLRGAALPPGVTRTTAGPDLLFAF